MGIKAKENKFENFVKEVEIKLIDCIIIYSKLVSDAKIKSINRR